MFAHYQWFLNPSSVVFDLRDVSEDKSAADVTRILLQFASKLQHRKLNSVTLSYRGSPRFKLQGSYFEKLGAEYGTQNPVYTIRTLPENLLNLDGSNAFGVWTGGLLGVMSKQMEDFSKFHRQWYIDDLR